MTILATHQSARADHDRVEASLTADRRRFLLSLAAVAMMFGYRVFIPRLPTMNLSLQNIPVLVEGVVLLALAGFAAVRLPGVLRRARWIEWLALGYAALASVSCLWTPDPVFALTVVGKLAVTVVLVVDAAQRASSVRDLRWVLYAVGLGIGLHAILPWLGLIWPETVHFHHTGRMMHPWISPTNWSVLAAVGALLCLYAADRSEGKRRLWWFPGLVLGAITIWLSMGKTGLLALPIGAVVFAMATRRIKPLFELGVVMVLVAAPLLVFYPPLLTYWKVYLGNPRFLATLSGRTLLWTNLVENIDAVDQSAIGYSKRLTTRHRPRPQVRNERVDLPPVVSWTLGHGYTAMRQTGIKVTNHYWVSRSAHNGYLGVLRETGVIGLSLILAAIGLAVRRLWRLIRDDEDEASRRLAVETAGLLALLLVGAVFVDLFGGMPRAESLLLWPVLAVAAALARLQRDNNSTLGHGPKRASASGSGGAPNVGE